MNKKSKIIVSVVGITIVLLALLGITYAYYLTRIEGNTNTNSISVTTADLKLVYGDGNGLVTANDIMPGTTITKTFTVTNDGESRVEDYVVVLEQIVNTLDRTQDLTYTLTCKLANETSCGETTLVDGKGPVFPSGVTEKAIFLNSIDKDVTHYYTLVVTYENLIDTDQSDDMGSSISALVNIKDKSQIDTTGLNNPSNKTLAETILASYGGESAITEVTDFNTVTTGLYKSEDNLGTTYFYRGTIENNYVLFNNMCFRIVRIEGDGSLKLVYSGIVNEGETNCNGLTEDSALLYDEDGNILYKQHGYKRLNYAADDYDYYYHDYKNSVNGMNEILQNWYTSNFKTDALKNKIKNDKWCLGKPEEEIVIEFDIDEDGIIDDYEWNLDPGNPENDYVDYLSSLKCEDEIHLFSSVGALNYNEAINAGMYYEYSGEGEDYQDEPNALTYLYENAQTESYWLLSYYYFGPAGEGPTAYSVSRAVISDEFITYGKAVRPAITLIPETTIFGGNGTKTNPYTIS